MINLKRVWFFMRGNFWFLPAIYGSAALAVAIVITNADTAIIKHWKELIPNTLLTSADVAKDLYSALATAILTMTTISFSTIMVVLTTYSTQFSPRTLQDFMRSKPTHHVLGVYTFGFLFALINLLMVGKQEQFIGPITMVVSAIFGLAFFIYFIHMTSKQLQVNQLIKKIHTDGSRLIKVTYREKKYIETGTWDEEELKWIHQSDKYNIYSKESGYVQNIEWKELFNWAEKEDAVIEVHAQAGKFLLKGEPLISLIYINETDKFDKKLTRLVHFMRVGAERSDVQDIEFTIEKLVEIALRAISPAINDPHTAINCINRLGSILVEIGKNNKEMRFLANPDRKLRIIRPNISFDQYLYKSFYQIKHYGKEDISVLYALLEVMAKVASISGDGIRKHIWNYHYEVLDVFEWKELSNQDYLHMRCAYDYLLESCGESIRETNG